jgi:hypothetical protein
MGPQWPNPTTKRVMNGAVQAKAHSFHLRSVHPTPLHQNTAPVTSSHMITKMSWSCNFFAGTYTIKFGAG